MSETVVETSATPVAQPEKAKGFDVDAILKSPALIPGVVFFLGIVALFWNMIKYLPTLWGSEDGYYSHGYIVPLISGYIVYKNWDNLKDREIKPQYWIGVLLLGVAYFAYLASVTQMYFLASVTLIGCLMITTVFVAGWQWLKGLFFPIAYLGFALPLFSMVIDTYTNPLQLISTKIANTLLQMFGANPYMTDAQTIMLDRFTLNVDVPCSGLKLLLALGAFTTFFMLVANLRWWANAIMIAQWIPLALFINGLRIALIGLVGNAYGPEAGMQFHDYSGYITLVVCFIVLFKIARGLGWKD